jgi:nitrous oxide reductase
MSNVSRRQFLRNASLGAAAAGALAVGGTSLVSAIATTEPATSAPPSDNGEAQDGSDVFARVIDARSGRIKLYVGTKEVDYTDQALAQQLLRATQ